MAVAVLKRQWRWCEKGFSHERHLQRSTAPAIALGVHHEAIIWLASSVRAVPPGTVGSVTEMARGAILQSLNAMALAIRLGFPFLAATTLGHAVLGALGRAAPQMHFSSLGFSVSILFGGGALWLLTPPMLKLAAEATLSAFSAR